MREILFRGKRIDNGEWIYGDLRQYSKKHIGIYSFELQQIVRGIDPSTVGQYTGLKDKNGKRIFEGDMVEGVCYNEDDGYGVVEWDDGAFIVSNNDWCGSFVENYYGEMFKIIGNTHDNPELLEER